MKIALIIISLSVFALQGCKNSSTDTQKDKLDKTTPVENVEASSTTSATCIVLNKEAFIEKVWDYENFPDAWAYKGDKPAIIDFYADWCRPCKIAGPILEELAQEYANDIYIYKINTEVEQELASVFGISGIPAFLYIPQNSQPVMSSGIAQTEEETKQMFKENIEKILLQAN
jgi:thioredoxin